RHQDAGRAVAALQPVGLAKGLLKRVQPITVGCERLHGGDRVAVRLHGEHQARPRGRTIVVDRACAAYAVLAADVGAGQTELVAEEIAQQQARLDPTLAALAVHRGDDRVRVGRHRLALASAVCSARRVSTTARWRWNALLACTLPDGSRSRSAAAAASR